MLGRRARPDAYSLGWPVCAICLGQLLQGRCSLRGRIRKHAGRVGFAALDGYDADYQRQRRHQWRRAVRVRDEPWQAPEELGSRFPIAVGVGSGKAVYNVCNELRGAVSERYG